MTQNHIQAVFKAEYYTTTSKFRKARKYIPIGFLIGVFLFGFVLRLFYDLILSDQEFELPDVSRFFSLITIFSYFTLFAPLLSPLGRIVYDGGARSRREVALSTPVTNYELLYGNLLSNLVFYLPFFGFIGTVMLAPFFGSGKYSPAITAILLFTVLSMLILIGLISGTLIAPLISHYISKSKSNVGRAFVMFGMSGLLVTSLPIFQYLIAQSQNNGNAGVITYLPFTIAGSIIISVLYDVEIGVSIQLGFILLLTFLISLIVIAHKSADRVYGIGEDEIIPNYSNPKSLSSKFSKIMTYPIPRQYKVSTKVIFQASLRDVEQLSRLSIGIAITIFMVFAFSEQGLFADATGFGGEIRAVLLLMTIIVSAGTIIFIESSSFVVQHRNLLEIIKSSPLGSKKFVISKLIQVNLVIIPLYTVFCLILIPLNFLEIDLAITVMGMVLLILNSLISICLCIYLINPIDNEEDLGNFVNMIIFYIFIFILVIPPVSFVLAGGLIKWYHIVMYIGLLVSFSVFSATLSIKLLDQMNVENLKSDLSEKIVQAAKSLFWLFLAWNVLPIFSLLILLFTDNIIFVLLLTNFLVLTIPFIYWKANSIHYHKSSKSTFQNILELIKIISLMFVSLLLIILIFQNTNQSSPNTFILKFDLLTLLIFLIIQVSVEEIFFRWFLYDYGLKKIGLWGSRILNAILFGFVHPYPLISFVNAIVQAIWLTILRDKTNTIHYPILAHLLFNLTILIPLYY